MSRFLLSALGSAGDVHPFIVVAAALRARGHDVRLMATPYFEKSVADAGVAFVPLGPPGDYERVLARAELWEPRRGARFVLDALLDRLPEAYATGEANVETSDTIVVGSTLSWGVRLLQETRGLRGATMHLSPAVLTSAVSPPILPGLPDLSRWPAWLVRALQSIGERLVLDRLVAPRLNRFRATLGLPPVARVWSRWMHSPDLVVAAWPEWFAPSASDWPAATRTTGFPLHRDGGASTDPALDPALAAFLAAGPPPIGITAGSAMAHGEAFFAKSLDACRATGHRALLITAFTEVPPDLPPWAHAVRYAPFGALLPRLAALVHHGGIGTTAQSLAAGIPQLVAPFAHDQFDNAARLERLGVATSIDRDAPDDAWAEAVRKRVSAGPDMAAVAAARARMRADGPAEDRIAPLLETLANRPAASQPIAR